MKTYIKSLLLAVILISISTGRTLARAESSEIDDDALPVTYAQSEMDDASSVTLKHDPAAPDVASGDATDTDEAPPKTQEHFSVTTWKIQPKKAEAKPIQLLLPQHNSKFTPGVVTFSWKLSPTVKKKKVLFVLEKLDTKKRATQFWKGEKLSIELKSGNYRWQISSTTPKVESHWRFFSIIDMKSKSLSKLYDGKSRTISAGVANSEESDDPVTKKEIPRVASAPSQDTSESDINSNSSDDDEKLKQFKQEKLKAEKEAKDLENQLEVAKLEHKNALKAAQEQAAKLKTEKIAKAKAQKEVAARLAKAEAERKAQLKAEKEAKARIAKIRAKQFADYQIAKMKAEKATKKLQAKINAERSAKVEADQAAKELSQKVEVERQATARIKGLAKDDDDDETTAPVAAPVQRRATSAKRVVQNPADSGPPAEPPPVPGNSDSGEPTANARLVPARIPAQQARGSQSDDAPKRGDTDTLKFNGE